MKALSFFILLNHAYRLEATEQMKSIMVVDMPNMDQSQRQRVLDQLQRISGGIIGLGDNNDYSEFERLKKEL